MRRYLRICILVVSLILMPYFGMHCIKAQSTSQCNTCLPNGKVCIDAQNYMECDAQGKPLGVEHSCQAGTVCTANDIPCAKPTDDVKAICSICSDCGRTPNRYVCLDEVTYGFCFDQDTVDPNTIMECPPDRYCTIGTSQICSPMGTSFPACSIIDNPISTDSSTDQSTVQPTDSSSISIDSSSDHPTYTTQTTDFSTITTDSSSVPTELTTLPTPINADEYCTAKKAEGRFKVESDKTCKSFIICSELSSEFFGWLWYCDKNSYYSTVTENCEQQRPENC